MTSILPTDTPLEGVPSSYAFQQESLPWLRVLPLLVTSKRRQNIASEDTFLLKKDKPYDH